MGAQSSRTATPSSACERHTLKTFLQGLRGESHEEAQTALCQWTSDGQSTTEIVDKVEDRPPSPVACTRPRFSVPPRQRSPLARVRRLSGWWQGAPTTIDDARPVVTDRQRPMDQRGVRWDCLRDRLHTYASNASWTTKDVVDLAIRSVTSTLQCAYYELLLPREGWTDTPDFMVSHVWSQPFQVLVHTVDRYAARFHREHSRWPYVLIDFACLNQHVLEFGCTTRTGKRLELMDLLDEMLLASGALLVCAHPWRQPKVFTRIWCIFEIARCLHWKLPLVISLASQDMDEVKRLPTNDERFVDILLAMDVGKAEASVATDRTTIMKHIRQHSGVDGVNRSVRMAVARHVWTMANEMCEPAPPPVVRRPTLHRARTTAGRFVYCTRTFTETYECSLCL